VYPDLAVAAGEAGIQLADQSGDLLGGGVGEVRVTGQVVGDEFGGVLRPDPGRLKEPGPYR
jgi:hypothetical protein